MNLSPQRARARALACVCLTAIGFTSAGPALAATELQPLTVTASRLPTIVEQLPTGTVVIDQDTIKASPATNLADLLDTVAGVTARRLYGINGARTSVDMLGFGVTGNDNVLVLLNGRRINAPDLSELNFSFIPKAAIERIEVLAGSGSALYGEGAAGGVINIVTFEQYQDSVAATLRGGDYGTLGGTIQASTQRGNTSVMASAESLDTEGYRDNGEIRQRSSFLDLRNQGDVFGWNLTLTTNDERIGLPGDLVNDGVTNEIEDDPTRASTPLDWAREEGFIVMPGVAINLSESLRFNLDLSSRERDRSAYYADFFYYEESELRSWSAAPRLTWLVDTGNLFHTITAGADFLDDKLYRPSSSSPDTISDPSYRKNVRRNEVSHYLHDVILIGERWNLTLGARQSHLETDTYTFLAAFPPFPASRTRTDRIDSLEMYQAGIQFNPVPQLALFLNGEKSARLPNADEVASGNPEPLIPQTGKVLTAGMRWQQGGQQSTLTTWYGKFDDEILYLDNGSGFCCNTNLEDQTRRQGVSLNTRFELDSDLWLTLNGSWQEATFAEGDLRGNDLPQIPEYSAFGQFDWQALNWLRATLAHRYVGERRLQGDLDNNASMQESYTWTDLVLAAKHGPWSSRIGVYNLEDNVVSDTGFDLGVGGYNGYPLPDRHVMAEIGVQW